MAFNEKTQYSGHANYWILVTSAKISVMTKNHQMKFHTST